MTQRFAKALLAFVLACVMSTPSIAWADGDPAGAGDTGTSDTGAGDLGAAADAGDAGDIIIGDDEDPASPSIPDVPTPTSGICGANASWAFDQETGTLTITRTSELISTASVDVAAWAAWAESITEVVIEEGVTSISEAVFASGFFSSVSIASTVSSIGTGAFSACTLLDSVNFGEPSQLASLGANAFLGCTALASISIPAGVTEIPNMAFSGCTSLAQVGGMDGVQSIGASAFAGTSALVSFTVPAACTSIGALAFARSGIQSVGFSSDGSLTAIGDQAFTACTGLAQAQLPSSLTSLGKRVFQSCSSLVTVGSLGQIAQVPDYAFDGCSSLASIDIPATVTAVGRYAFRNCSQAFRGGIVFSAALTDISAAAFSGCSALARFEFLGNAPAIADTAFANVMADAIYPNGNTTWTKSAKQNYGGTLTWFARMASGTLMPDTYESSYTEVPLAEGTYKEASFNDNQTGYAFLIKVASAEPVRFDFSWALPCGHNYFAISIIDSAGNVVAGKDVYYCYDESANNATMSQRLTAGTYHVEVTYRVGHRGETASMVLRYSASSPYYDVSQGAWYYDAVFDAAVDGLMTGYGDGRFGPDDSVTRAQAVTALWRHYMPTASRNYDASAAVNRTGMGDVASGAYYTEAANWAVENGIIHGIEHDGVACFEPDAALSRSQLCQIMENVARQLDGRSVGTVSSEKLDAMPDVRDVPAWAREAMAWSLNEGVINGVEQNGVRYARPDIDVTRAQLAQVLENYY